MASARLAGGTFTSRQEGFHCLLYAASFGLSSASSIGTAIMSTPSGPNSSFTRRNIDRADMDDGDDVVKVVYTRSRAGLAAASTARIGNTGPGFGAVVGEAFCLIQ